jgi:hypothetical protein
MKRTIILAVFILVSALPVLAFAEIEMSVDGGITGITSNSVIDIEHDSSSVYLGTGGGLSVSSNGGSHWITYDSGTLPSSEVSALAANNRAVWVGNSHSQSASGAFYPYGDGISLSHNGGLTWQSFTPRQVNFYGQLSYDLAVYDSLAYSACFYGGLIRSTDWGATWQNLYPTQLDSINTDSIDFVTQDFQSLGNRFFSVKADTSDLPNLLSIWGGDANGIHRFYFYADSITHALHTYPDSIAHYYFNLSDTTVADSLKLPGNHVVAIGIAKVDTFKIVWAACRPVSTGESRRVAYSLDNGVTWHTANITGPAGDTEIEAWDFAFAQDTTYVATGFGMFRSSGDYLSWSHMSGFRDTLNQSFYQDNAPIYAVDIKDGTIWAGGADGAIRSIAGDGWDVYRSGINPDDVYAYPSPFSPAVSIRKGTTIHFKPDTDTKASVRIYDFNLELVKTVAENIPRRGGVESDDIVWDGTNDKGKFVANGVYFFRIELENSDDMWGKVVVIK